MFDSKRIISTVVRDAEGQRVFWATSAQEYSILGYMQGVPNDGTVVTLDRDGNCKEFTVKQFEDLLNEEGLAAAETAAMCLGCTGPDDGPGQDYEQIEHDRLLQEYDRVRNASVTCGNDDEDTIF